MRRAPVELALLRRVLPVGRAPARIGAVVALLIAAVAFGGSPSAAQGGADLEDVVVEASTASDGWFTIGRPLVVAVTVRGTAARSGRVRLLADGTEVASTPLDLAGGSAKTVHLVLPAQFWPPVLIAEFVTAEGVADRLIGLEQATGDEIVAVLPAAAGASPPETADLSVPVGLARLSTLDPALLALGPVAVATYSQMVATPADLDALDPAAENLLARWVSAAGGRLVVVAPDGVAADGPLPLGLVASADPAPATVGAIAPPTRVGLGSVQLVATPTAAGNLDGVLQPQPMSMPTPAGGIPGTLALAHDARVSPPEILSLVAGVAGYGGLVAVVWLVLRRSRREPTVWLVLPVLALVTTAVVYGVGQLIRSDASLAHATVVADLPGARLEETWVMVTAPGGGDRGVHLDAGWEESTSSQDAWFVEGRPEAWALPARRGDDLVVDLPPGGVGTVSAAREAGAEVPNWNVSFEPGDDGGLKAVVTNATRHLLDEVFVLQGTSVDRLGSVEPGAVETVSVPARPEPVLMVDPWLDEMMNRADPSTDNGRVNYGLINEWMARHPEARRPDAVTVIGWTRDRPGPLTTLDGATVTVGRTALVTVVPSPGPATGLQVISSDLAGGQPEPVDDADPGLNRCVGPSVTGRWPVADGPGPHQVSGSTRDVVGLDLLVAGSWTATEFTANEGTVAVPEGGVAPDGYVYTRFSISCDVWGGEDLSPVLEPVPGPTGEGEGPVDG
ncbi:MAG: hypothetical protein ACK5RL_15010 [Acidimicrobiales bacterium]